MSLQLLILLMTSIVYGGSDVIVDVCDGSDVIVDVYGGSDVIDDIHATCYYQC